MLQQVSHLCQQIHMPEPATQQILSLLPQLDLPFLEPAMKQLFREETWDSGLELLKQQLGEDPLGMKMLTCMLICALSTREQYEKLGISETVFLDTMDCFPRFVKEHMVCFGTYGFDRDFWTVRQLSCKLFRIGLLEYELEKDNVALHIPSGAKLMEDQLDASLEKSRSFLETYFPQWAALPRTCHSWLLSPTLADLLPPEARIRKFQDRFSVIPTGYDSNDYLMWAFQTDSVPVEQLPENTSLQRALKAHLLSGGTFVDVKGTLK